MTIPNRISDFILENEVMTIATSSQNIPYCATVFYVFLPDKNLMVFMSDIITRHMQDALSNKIIAGTIIAKDVNISNVKGLQFTGNIFKPEPDLKEECTSKYLWAFPMAILHKSSLWTVEFTFLKLTDNHLGFGKKIIWNHGE